jgi:hypothetical protein
VIGSSPALLWLQKHLEFHCEDCGSSTGFRSRRRSFSERYLLPIFLLQPARCAECFRRDYRSLFMPLKNRMSETIRKAPEPLPESERNVA